MRRVFVGLAQVFVGLAAQLWNNRLLRKKDRERQHMYLPFFES